MKKVYQKIIDKGNGDCVRAAVTSMMDLEYNDVPDMAPNTGNQAGILMDFMRSNGYHYEGTLFNRKYNILYYANQLEYCKGNYKLVDDCLISVETMSKYKGINGLFLAAVLSPNYTAPMYGIWGHHQVICDSELNVVFDPSPDYVDIERYPLTDLIGFNGICYIEMFEKEKEKVI